MILPQTLPWWFSPHSCQREGYAIFSPLSPARRLLWRSICCLILFYIRIKCFLACWFQALRKRARGGWGEEFLIKCSLLKQSVCVLGSPGLCSGAGPQEPQLRADGVRTWTRCAHSRGTDGICLARTLPLWLLSHPDHCNWLLITVGRPSILFLKAYRVQLSIFTV